MKMKLYGVVATCTFWTQYIYCADAPVHLREHRLVGSERAKRAVPGDRVVLEYRTTPSSGGWYAKKL